MPLAPAACGASGAGRAADKRTAAAPTQSRIVKLATAPLLLLLLLPPDDIAGPNMLIVVLGFFQRLLDEKFLCVLCSSFILLRAAEGFILLDRVIFSSYQTIPRRACELV